METEFQSGKMKKLWSWMRLTDFSVNVLNSTELHIENKSNVNFHVMPFTIKKKKKVGGARDRVF